MAHQGQPITHRHPLSWTDDVAHRGRGRVDTASGAPIGFGTDRDGMGKPV
ncbi:hypothetical protein UO65_0558 [Actinokineospora spheciospongiae]|uniref:Uncharacterized protein n=1 Tax=Actinokineospora spheciospongiae TaxID=909613 RepID=W7J568_9PSEU|nr:hypothetical protein UO65_0558 [Actinokineospora spheciospongiae]